MRQDNELLQQALKNVDEEESKGFVPLGYADKEDEPEIKYGSLNDFIAEV